MNPASFMKAVGLPSAAALLTALVALRAVTGGFLADDYYLGHQIAERAERNPGPIGALRDAFAHRWSEQFQLFRPLTVLTIQTDYAVHGPDGGRHHLTNIALWALVATAFGFALCGSVGTVSARHRALAILLLGTCPAAIEALGWLVARGDLIAALFGLLATRHLLARPDAGLIRALILLPAFLGNDAAIVLPPLLLWVDLWIGRDRVDRTRPRFKRLLRRHAPSLILLAGYFALRLALFGAIGSKYNGRTYGEFLGDPETPGRALEALLLTTRALFVPVNEAMATLLFPGVPGIVPTLAFLIPWGVLVGLGCLTLRGHILRPLLAWLPWIFGPVLMLAPLFSVQSTLEESRILVIPLAGFMMLMGRLVFAALERSPRLAGTALALLFLAGGAAMQIDLEAFRRAADRARRVRSDFEAIPNGQRVVVLRAADDPQLTALSVLNGVYVLSAGMNKSVRAPFREAPGIHSDPLPRALESDLAAYVERGARTREGRDVRASRPWVATCVLDASGEPRIEVIGRGGYKGTPPQMTPAHGAEHARTRPLEFRVRGPEGRARAATTLRLVVTEPGGKRVAAELPVAEPRVRFEDGHYEVRLSGGDLAPLPLDPTTLPHLPVPVILWWIELVDGEETYVRSPYAVVRLVP